MEASSAVPSPAPRNGLYSSAIFAGSFLLFLIQPMAARRLLPLLGGSAAVWITCLIFFQFSLLLGYLAAHVLATHLRKRTSALLYSSMLLASLLQAFLLKPELPASTAHPVASVFLLLTAYIGLPFLALSMTTPLLQAWHAAESETQRLFSRVTPPSTAISTYRFFAVSNLASLLALIVYPWLLEPRFGLAVQNRFWRVGFVLFALLAAIIIWRAPRGATFALTGPVTGREKREDVARGAAGPVLWFLLAACGTWLLCAFTNHLNQNVAAVPMLWVLPLMAYLLSFVWAFIGERYHSPRWLLLALPFVLIATTYSFYRSDFSVAIGLLLLFFCVALLLCCLFCNAELYRMRPAPRHLTSFYACIAAGGMTGSAFVGIAAPLLFPTDYELPGGLVFLSLLALVLTWRRGNVWRLIFSTTLLLVGVLTGKRIVEQRRDVVAQARTFYGALRVVEDHPLHAAWSRALYHGTVLHGAQFFGSGRGTVPFYGHDSGIALAIEGCCPQRSRRIGVIGLGAGSLAAYAARGDTIRFYELDPLVIRMAVDFFTYMRDSPGAIQVIPGDGRLSLASETPLAFDVLAIDAFSGGAVPLHLLTAEAFDLYRRHLRWGGVLAINITNDYVDLAPIVAQQAERVGWQTRYFESSVNYASGEYVVDWVLLTDNQEFLLRPEIQNGQPLAQRAGLRLWTDDYNSLFPIFSLRNRAE